MTKFEVVLTIKQTEVYKLLKQGLSPNQIAEKLVLSKHTIRNHVAAIHTKLGTIHMNELLTMDCTVKTVMKKKSNRDAINKMLIQGYTAREISRKLQESINTVYVYK